MTFHRRRWSRWAEALSRPLGGFRGWFDAGCVATRGRVTRRPRPPPSPSAPAPRPRPRPGPALLRDLALWARGMPVSRGMSGIKVQDRARQGWILLLGPVISRIPSPTGGFGRQCPVRCDGREPGCGRCHRQRGIGGGRGALYMADRRGTGSSAGHRPARHPGADRQVRESARPGRRYIPEPRSRPPPGSPARQPGFDGPPKTFPPSRHPSPRHPPLQGGNHHGYHSAA